MESEGRKISKIAREVSKFTVKTMREEGIGTAEFDLIHLIRHNPGITQAQIREQLGIDKGAAARRVARLEEKGYLVREVNEEDRRSARIYATRKAEMLKNSKVDIETCCYERMLSELTETEKKEFLMLLDKVYRISKKESREGFPNVRRTLPGRALEKRNGYECEEPE